MMEESSKKCAAEKVSVREKLLGIIEKDDSGNVISHVYDLFMIALIVVSLVPLTMKEVPSFFFWIDWGTTSIFIVDYILRWLTADIKLGMGKRSFLVYPLTPFAIIDLLSVLPTLLSINAALRALKVFRLIKALRVFKLFKGFRYSKNIEIIVSVLHKQKRSLVTVCFLSIGYILLSALVVFNVEPETFNTFFDAVYWATVSLTTVGYGDIYTVSVVGKIFTMISAVLGVAIVALPAGIITAGYMNEIQNENGDNPSCDKKNEDD